ncbi:sensor histidine kinase [Halobacteriales archaeon QS_8_69_26]|nr:MAG: sensor histidine kinase [Halobacteriales archaeon QS_8_69_26]
MALSPFALALAVASVTATVAAGLAWYQRHEPGARPLVVFNLAVALGTGGYAVDVASTSLSTQLLFTQVWLIGQAFTATTWVYVAIEYTGHGRWASPRTAALVAAEPLAFAVAVLVPPLRRALFTVTVTEGTGRSLFYQGIEPSGLLLAHLFYLFVVAIVGSLLFVRLFVRSRHLYRTQATAVLVAAIAPWTTVLAQSLGLAPSSDPSALTWALSGVALTAGLFRFKTLDPVPTAHESIVAEMGDGVVVLDEDGTIGDMNPAARRLLSPEGPDPVGRRADEVFGDWDRVDIAADGDDWQELSVEVDGDRRYVEVQVSSFTDRFDRLVGRLVVVRDVTERMHREQTLARYKTIFDSVRDPVYVLDADDRFVMVNEPFASLVRRDRADLVGEPFASVLADGDGPVGVPRSAAEADPSADGFEITIRTAEGGTVPCETRRAPIEFEGEAGGTVGFVRDISRRKRIQTELAETTERLETLVEASPVAIVAVEEAGTVEVWNPAAEELFDWPREAVLGDPLPIVPEEHRDRIREQYDRVLAGERITGFEVELQRRDGGLVETDLSAAPLHDADGEVDGAVAVIRDISERKERERRLQRQNERLDEFASLVSHDLRNPLQVATGSLQTARETGDEEWIADALSALERMETIIEDSLSLARQGSDVDDPEPVEFELAIRRAWGTVVTGDATLEVGEIPTTVRADDPRLRDLLENLFANAVDHGGDGVTVTVEWDDAVDGFYVADDGAGVPEERRQEVFESGFTTTEGGTGFGLAIVNRIAEAHGWTVHLTDSEDGGARFEVRGVETAVPVGSGE